MGSFAWQLYLEIPFVDKSIDKNDKSPPTNLERQNRQKQQKYRAQFIYFTSFSAVECMCIANETKHCRPIAGFFFTDFAASSTTDFPKP